MSSFDKILRLENISYDLDALTSEGEEAKEMVRHEWFTTRRTIEAIQAIVKNPVVKVILGMVIKIGDGLEEKIHK